MKQLSFLPFADTTITIYNKYQWKTSAGKVMTSWMRTVIPNCFKTKASSSVELSGTQSNNVVLSSDYTLIEIPMYDNYIPPRDWSLLTNEEMVSKFTVNEDDLIIIGEVTDEVGDLVSIDTIKQKYGSLAVTVAKANDNYGKYFPIPHIGVTS